MPTLIPSASATLRHDLPCNRGWRFLRLDGDGTPVDESAMPAVDLDDSDWDQVVLPHTPLIEPARTNRPWQGICWYRRTIPVDPSWCGRRASLIIHAAMQIAQVWINGQPSTTHLGGYLPFAIDLSARLEQGPSITIAIRLDNRDTVRCPPGKPLAELDFAYFGGLYRGASLVISDLLHVSDPLAAGIEAGGGILITTRELTADRATVGIQTHISNAAPVAFRRVQVRSTVIDPDGHVVGEALSWQILIGGGAGHHLVQDVTIPQPREWHPDHPWMYRLLTEVLRDGVLCDRVESPFGIRRFSCKDRLLLNGRELRLLGSNRHQDHPWIGNALSPRAGWRDIKRMKNAGLNFVRLAHYPQDTAVLDACDELGLVLMAPIPGWQCFHANEEFIARSFQDVRDLVRRDRNHPSLLVWECNLNETDADHADWQRTAHEIVHRELPGDQTFTWGDPYPAKPWDWDVAGLVREYGDWCFGGNASTSRVTRGDGEAALLQQAWNFQWCLNDIQGRFGRDGSPCIGSATWVMFDYNRGYHERPCASGMMDLYRLEKPVRHLFLSQSDPDLASGPGPVVHIATGWSARPSPCRVVVYSNCDEIELLCNGTTLGRSLADSGPDTPYGQTGALTWETKGDGTCLGFDASGGRPFDGGNCRHLDHPPFTFSEVPWTAGELVAIGYRGGLPVAEHRIRTPGEPSRLAIAVDDQGLPLMADGADAVFLRILVHDPSGTVVPDAVTEVRIRIDGPGVLIGPNPCPAEAGIASVLVRAIVGQGPIRMTAEASGMRAAHLVIHPVPAPGQPWHD